MSEAHMKKIEDDLMTAELSRASHLSVENKALRDERDRYKKALEQLAILGNEPFYGNSDGNRIAQKALGIDPSAYMTKPTSLTPAGGGQDE